jgi:hypothetical protein
MVDRSTRDQRFYSILLSHFVWRFLSPVYSVFWLFLLSCGSNAASIHRKMGPFLRTPPLGARLLLTLKAFSGQWTSLLEILVLENAVHVLQLNVLSFCSHQFRDGHCYMLDWAPVRTRHCTFPGTVLARDTILISISSSWPPALYKKKAWNLFSLRFAETQG